MIPEIKGKFSKIENQGKKTKLFTVELEDEIEFLPGQFVNLIFEANEETYMKPYSIASSRKSKKEVELTINLVEDGRATPHLFKKEIGDEVKIKGPLGLFTIKESNKEKIAMIGTGTGVGPLRSMILDLLETSTGKIITLVLGIRYEDEILFQKEFEELEKLNPNFKFVPVISKPTDMWEGRSGHVQENLDVIDSLNSQVYICGLPKMVEEVKQKLIDNGAEESEIHFERYV